jgi:group I intron endonuclease
VDTMEESNYLVYLATDPYTGKKYAGQTKQKLSRRLSGHVTTVRSGVLTSFGHAIAKYGIKNFTISVLREGMTKEQADEEERSVIKNLRLTEDEFGYNMMPGGAGTPFTEEVKRKMKAHSGQRRWDVNDEEIISLYNDGKGLKEIAIHFNMSLSAIGWRLKMAGIKTRRGFELPEGEIIRLYKEGHSQNEIGAMFGASDSPVFRVLKKYGVKCTRKRCRLPKEAIEMYNAGMSTKSIGDKFGKSAPFVARNLREMGVVITQKGKLSRRNHKPRKIIPDEAIGLYAAGYSFAELGRRYGFSDAGMRNRLILLGVSIRGKSGKGTRPRNMLK